MGGGLFTLLDQAQPASATEAAADLTEDDPDHTGERGPPPAAAAEPTDLRGGAVAVGAPPTTQAGAALDPRSAALSNPHNEVPALASVAPPTSALAECVDAPAPLGSAEEVVEGLQPAAPAAEVEPFVESAAAPSAVALPTSALAESVDAHAPLGSDEEVVEGLSGVFEAARLSPRSGAAAAWCQEQGAANLEEILEALDDFVQALGLKIPERRLLEKALKAAVGGEFADDIAEEGVPEVEGLRQVFADVKLQEHAVEACAWCSRSGLRSMQEVVAVCEDLGDHLGLKPMQRKRLAKAVAAQARLQPESAAHAAPSPQDDFWDLPHTPGPTAPVRRSLPGRGRSSRGFPRAEDARGPVTGEPVVDTTPPVATLRGGEGSGADAKPAAPAAMQPSPELVSALREKEKANLLIQFLKSPAEGQGGKVSKKDLDQAIVDLPIRASPEDKDALFGAMGPDSSGFIGFGELQRYLEDPSGVPAAAAPAAERKRGFVSSFFSRLGCLFGRGKLEAAQAQMATLNHPHPERRVVRMEPRVVSDIWVPALPRRRTHLHAYMLGHSRQHGKRKGPNLLSSPALQAQPAAAKPQEGDVKPQEGDVQPRQTGGQGPAIGLGGGVGLIDSPGATLASAKMLAGDDDEPCLGKNSADEPVAGSSVPPAGEAGDPAGVARPPELQPGARVLLQAPCEAGAGEDALAALAAAAERAVKRGGFWSHCQAAGEGLGAVEVWADGAEGLVCSVVITGDASVRAVEDAMVDALEDESDESGLRRALLDAGALRNAAAEVRLSVAWPLALNDESSSLKAMET